MFEKKLYNDLDHLGIQSVDALLDVFKPFACSTVLIKKLGKNNNDKNQVYIHSNPDFLNGLFDLEFGYREPSTSRKKLGTGLPIPVGIFNEFYWLDTEGKQHRVPDCKAVFYAQYPEVRLSGFKADSGIIPASMSIGFTKSNPEATRFLALGGDSQGKTYAVMVVEPENKFLEDFKKLDYHRDSKACKVIEIAHEKTASKRLESLLKERVGGKDVKGCRLDASGTTLPFNAPQVHGYTLEHELGIATNASKEGDIFGIELKCFTGKRLTLFTTEPDGGLYSVSFDQFMRKYGYAKEAVYRFTGLHRVGSQGKRSGLSLRVLCSNKREPAGPLVDYDTDKKFKDQLQNLQVVLMDDEDEVAASWSLARLLENWGIKHNEAVYVPATVRDNEVREEVEQGYRKRVHFGCEVLWCKGTSVERMIRAIVEGVIFLDPAPKLDPDGPKNNKRRSQWRINNIYRDSEQLYKNTSIVNII